MQSKLGKFFILLSFSITVSFQTAHGQNPEELIADIERYRELTVNAIDPPTLKKYNDSCLNAVRDFLDLTESHDMELTGKFIGDLRSPDDRFRMITWNIPREDGTYEYYNFMQLPDESRPYFLKASSGGGERPETKKLNHEEWLGALYYEIIPFKHENEMHYTLLGWDGNNRHTTRKIIDLLYFNKYGEPMFGKPLFKGEDHMRNRVILEYKKDASVSLKYHKKRNQIIFNHLEPLEPQMEGIYQFYAPTLSFNAYELNKKEGEWIFKNDVEVIMKTQDVFNDPRGIKEPVEKPGNR